MLKTKYLGFIVGGDGIEVDPEKISVLENWQVPNTVRGIQSFLGFCNFYRRFIRNHGRIARPLVRLTRKNTPFKFDEPCQTAFRESKNRLLSAPILIQSNHEIGNRFVRWSSWCCPVTTVQGGQSVASCRLLFQDHGSCRVQLRIRKCLVSSVRYRNIERNW